MKKLLLIAWVMFIIGLFFRLLHYPGASVILVLGTLLHIIHSVIYLAQNAKSNLVMSFLHLSYASITTYILFRLQYWPGGPMIMGFSLFFIIVLLITLYYFKLQLTSKVEFKLPQIFLVLYFVIFIALSFTHSYSIYYFMNLNPVLNGDSRNTDYYSWDKYSWFLYIANKQEEAIEANQNAQKAANEYLKIIPDPKTSQYLISIEQHGQQIRDKNWTAWE